MFNPLSAIIGSRNSRLIKAYSAKVKKINQLEASFSALSDAELTAKTGEFKQRFSDGASLDSLLVEAFAVCREASKRTINMRHYDVQLIGGMVLHDGKIAEMRTGEGKTLVATLAVYLNALAGKGVHVITVNDYLAQRDSQWMGKLYNFLDLSVGIVVSQQPSEQKAAAYAADITYGTNNEFGFDYLRDNMAYRHEDQYQKNHNFAIVDEIDSILIDEARTPLIISGAGDDNVNVYPVMNLIPPKLTRQLGEIAKDGTPSADFKAGDYSVDEKSKQVYLSETGHEKVEKILAQKGVLPANASLYDAGFITLMQYVNAAIRAHVLYEKNVDYIVENGEVVIIDEFTGRKMTGRRWSDGLHQAVECKEGVAIQSENQTLASITFQNYFRLYDKLAGMTGTADTEAVEFQQIYKLEVVVIPTNKNTIRHDHADMVFLTQEEKFNAIVNEIKTIQSNNKQPILVGTASIETSESLSQALHKAGINHEVLNAKQHQREALIIAQAGRLGAVTIATNMAGRGTDIVLGGNPDYLIQQLEQADETAISAIHAQWQQEHQQVIDAGGLYVIGTERNESRRVDNQLRGRSGRQGDPGKSRFYLSLHDNLMRIFASDRMRSMMQKLGLKDGESIEHNMVNRAIANAQKKVEGHNYEVRKQLLEYDDVVNEQRQLIYRQRNQLLTYADVSQTIIEMRDEVFATLLEHYIPKEQFEDNWDIQGLREVLKNDFQLPLPIEQWLNADKLSVAEVQQRILDHWQANYLQKEALAGGDAIRQFEKAVLLQLLDNAWKEHLANLDYLRQGIHLRGYAQKSPVQEYKRESFEMFQDFLYNLRVEIIKLLSQVQIQSNAEVAEMERRQQQEQQRQRQLQQTHSAAEETTRNNAEQPTKTVRHNTPKMGRNDPCHCGSGKKYKHCCGRN